MSAILHVTKPGHKCHNPFGKKYTASRVQLGSLLCVGGWELWYAARVKAYIVCRGNLTGDHYEFHNFNCAAAKLAELGRA